jgi:phosphoenolpyruvate carboxykinase (GTP)
MWVAEVARQTEPERVIWCDGSEQEARELTASMLKDGGLLELNHASFPGCYLHRSHPTDVARTEHLTFICSETAEDAGPTNNWLSPEDARKKVGPLFNKAMKGRTMYVVPYLMGPVGSPGSRIGVEITDSPYVVLNMRIMTRMGNVALDALGSSENYCKGLHSLGDLSPDRRYICHFPKERLIWSIGSGYGGNALLGKKCFALRIASTMARDEGWMAEHMLILGLEDPTGAITYVCAAFPSACGKTNLAMLVAPELPKGWRVWTVGDDIAWLRVGEDGRLWAINPEAGFFGVAPGTSSKTNPNALATVQRNTIFTNVALLPDGTPWWEGLDGPKPKAAIDWRGKPWTPDSEEPAAHPNSRFTAPTRQCPCISKEIDAPSGVPISAIIFGGRRAKVAPLVYEARDWEHGVYVGATMASETTAAATGKIGVVRRDPMAMRPFCGYNMADYFGHWLAMGKGKTRFPKIFNVNWFRTNDAGKYLWPGFGENMRVLRWIHGRVHGTAAGRDTPIGVLPSDGALDATGLELVGDGLNELLSLDTQAWHGEMRDQDEFLRSFGSRLPPTIWEQYQAQKLRLGV